MDKTALKVAKEETKRQYIETSERLVTEFIKAGRQIGGQLAGSPVIQMLAFCILVEAAQRIEVKGEPLISEFLANSLEGVVITGSAISSISGSLTNLLPSLGGILAK